jgi:drug/metabolite transporter (DMT)-like permease
MHAQPLAQLAWKEMSLRLSQKNRIVIAFALVYLCWSATYGAIHIAGLHLAPPLVGACRSLFSTIVICGICIARGTSLRVPGRTVWRLALVGILMMTVNNLLLIWGETKVATGLASLIIAMVPIFVALIETALPGGETLNLRGWLGTFLGVLGMLVLLWPTLHRGSSTADHRSLLGFVILLVAALAFASGSVISRRFHFQVDTFVATAWEIGCAGCANLTIATVGGTFRTAQWTLNGVLAIAFLSIIGSVVGLTAYTYLLQHVPVTKVSTYAFVNPVIAVLIGVAAFHERLAPAELAGMVLILCSVATVILSRTKIAPPPTDPMLEVPIEE